MKIAIKGTKYSIQNVFGSNGLSNTIKIEHEDGFVHYIRSMMLNGKKATLIFDNFSIKPFVISTATTSVTRLRQSDPEEILKELYDNNIIDLDYSQMNTEEMIIKLGESGVLSPKAFNRAMRDYKMFFM